MDISKLLLANSFILAIVLIVLILISFRNGHAPTTVKDDIRKIKEQISNEGQV